MDKPYRKYTTFLSLGSCREELHDSGLARAFHLCRSSLPLPTPVGVKVSPFSAFVMPFPSFCVYLAAVQHMKLILGAVVSVCLLVELSALVLFAYIMLDGGNDCAIHGYVYLRLTISSLLCDCCFFLPFMLVFGSSVHTVAR